MDQILLDQPFRKVRGPTPSAQDAQLEAGLKGSPALKVAPEIEPYLSFNTAAFPFKFSTLHVLQIY